MKYLVALTVIISCSQFGFGQESIGSLVLEKVNQLRDSLSLNSLALDNVLSEAAKDHAYYMAHKNNLSHFQGTFSKETPSERVLFYKGNRTYVGENIATTSMKVKSNKQLDEMYTAERLFNSWLDSPPHYKNMIHPDYKKMGLGHWIADDKVVYSAQVFSSNEIRLPKQFRNSDLSWGVRPSEITCKDEPQTYETMFFANSVQVDGSSIYLYYHDLEFFKNVIRNDNDGLAIDVVLREQLPCGKENQFHISRVHDGEMQRPIYKHDIFRNNIADNPKKIRVKIGEVPAYLRNQQWEANLIIISDNKLCDYSVPVEVPSDIFPLLELKPYFDMNDELDSHKKSAFIRIKDSMHVELFYERSQKRFFSHSAEELNRMLGWNQFIKNVRVDCFASVEGAKWFNLQLLEDRVGSASSLLMESYFDLDKVSFSSAENWDLMEKQIKQYSLQKLKNKTEPQIRYFLKKNKSSLTDSLLFAQRKTHIRAWVDT
ncbi:MAG: CAP domain-containing protein, partial [Crocinitomicaceae bacterium]|nr:CAP domain-containing protein [Crocinitomicaceae bacterium]